MLSFGSNLTDDSLLWQTNYNPLRLVQLQKKGRKGKRESERARERKRENSNVWTDRNKKCTCNAMFLFYLQTQCIAVFFLLRQFYAQQMLSLVVNLISSCLLFLYSLLLSLSIVVFVFFFFFGIESVCFVFILMCTFLRWSPFFFGFVCILQHTGYLSLKMQIFWSGVFFFRFWVNKSSVWVGYTTIWSDVRFLWFGLKMR